MFGFAVRLRDLDGDGDKDLLAAGDYDELSLLFPAGASGITTGSVTEVSLRPSFPQ
jgi:hypothetical protein